MDLMNTIISAATTIFFFGAFAMLLTSPSWLVGRLSGKDLGDRRPSVLLRSKAFRWTLWVVASLLAYVGLFFIVMPKIANIPLGLAILIPGALFAQWAAFSIGRAKRLARMASAANAVANAALAASASQVAYGVANNPGRYTPPVYPYGEPPAAVSPPPPAQHPVSTEYPLAHPLDEYPLAQPVDDEYPLARPADPTDDVRA